MLRRGESYLKITICTIGSRGDIQPFLILGDYLSRQGHEVRVCSADMYSPMANKYQVEYVPFEGDYAKLVDNIELKKLIGGNPFKMKTALKQMVYPVLESSLDSFYKHSKWGDVVVYHPKSLVDSFGFLFPEKLIKAYVVPLFTPTKAFRSPILTFLPLPQCLNKLSYRITNSLICTVKAPVKNFYSRHNIQGKFKFIDTPIVYGISQVFLPRPVDYPSNHIFSGFWSRDQSHEELDEAVKTFLNTKRKKLIITFGSMPYKSKININDFIWCLTDNLNINVLLVKAWGLKDHTIHTSNRVLAIDRAPFEKLFPLADAVIHHGGAGTTAIALKAGIPMMICPILHPVGDQLFWGKQVERLGLGVAPIPLKKLTVNSLLKSVTQLIHTDLSVNTKRVKVGIEKEDGLRSVLDFVESHAEFSMEKIT